VRRTAAPAVVLLLVVPARRDAGLPLHVGLQAHRRVAVEAAAALAVGVAGEDRACRIRARRNRQARIDAVAVALVGRPAAAALVLVGVVEARRIAVAAE